MLTTHVNPSMERWGVVYLSFTICPGHVPRNKLLILNMKPRQKSLGHCVGLQCLSCQIRFFATIFCHPSCATVHVVLYGLPFQMFSSQWLSQCKNILVYIHVFIHIYIYIIPQRISQMSRFWRFLKRLGVPSPRFFLDVPMSCLHLMVQIRKILQRLEFEGVSCGFCPGMPRWARNDIGGASRGWLSAILVIHSSI